MLRIIVFLLASFISCSHTKDGYNGKVRMTCVSDGTPLTFGDKEGYLDGDYLFETMSTINSVEKFKVNPQTGEQSLIKSSEQLVLTSYVITNLKTKECFEFDTSSVAPKLVKKYTVDSKKVGLDLNMDIVSLYGINLDKIMVKDTIMDGNNYKQLKDTVFRANGVPPNWPLHSSKTYVNTDLKGFPVNLSPSLAKNYDGFVSQIDLETTFPNSKRKMIVSFKYTYEQGLSDDEKKLIEKYKALIR
ncbi:hypothetical protein VRU48_03930 [Pedobacter sp. KR3-3]|uniref:Lipoprotein n=1 Tax=Pedobacter albus TaxID=3113905 RepID=A0ABU7I4P9_9SPHI|nr:hypothetical protein [Pedobacter sp. KR3-3]MEE1944244.1 hypothetical protein [Pedobacter sp. KR3-3]